MRQELRPRRPNASRDVDWQNKKLTVTVGFDEADRICEVFADYAKPGSDTHAVLSDGLVMMSYVLQHGIDVEDLARHLGREGIDPLAPAASILGYVAITAAEMAGTKLES